MPFDTSYSITDARCVGDLWGLYSYTSNLYPAYMETQRRITAEHSTDDELYYCIMYLSAVPIDRSDLKQKLISEYRKNNIYPFVQELLVRYKENFETLEEFYSL